MFDFLFLHRQCRQSSRCVDFRRLFPTIGSILLVVSVPETRGNSFLIHQLANRRSQQPNQRFLRLRSNDPESAIHLGWSRLQSIFTFHLRVLICYFHLCTSCYYPFARLFKINTISIKHNCISFWNLDSYGQWTVLQGRRNAQIFPEWKLRASDNTQSNETIIVYLSVGL